MPRFAFRRLVAGDLPTMHRWLHEPEVVRWWEGDDITWAGVRDTYGTPGAEEHSIALLGGMPFGWVQCYLLAGVPEDAAWFAPLGIDPATTCSIDYLVGRAADRGQGLGAAMLRDYAAHVFDTHPAWTTIVVAPQRANAASWRALAAAGFDVAAVIDDPVGPCQGMSLSRR